LIEKEPTDKSADLQDDILLEDQNEMVTRWLPDGTLTYVNNVFCKYFQRTREELIGNKFIPNIPEDELNNFFDTILKSISPPNPAVSFEHRINLPNGGIRWLKWTDRAIFDNDNNIISYQSVGQDITAQKLAEEELRKSEERYKHLIESINVITWEYDIDLKRHIFVSQQAEKILGYSVDEWYKPEFWYTHLHPKDRNWASKFSDEQIAKGANHEFEYRMLAADGTTKWFREITSISSANGKPTRVNGIIIDISRNKMTEQNLRNTQLRLAALLNNLPNVVFYETGGGKEFITENILGLIGYSADEITRDRDFFNSLIHPEDRLSLDQAYEKWNKTNRAGILTCEFRIERKDGLHIWLEDHVFEINPEIGDRYISGVMIEISGRKKAEELIKDSLKEKELLIKEIHHRVKNNLQIVSSLLKLQSGYVKDQEALNMLLESQNRIQSMALVHQKLYQSKDLSRINFNEYLGQLLSHIKHAYKINADTFSINVNTENIQVDVDTAIPCGLIINELVTNSIKHAFPNFKKGNIHIDLKTSKDGHYILSVADDGIGFPEKLDFRNTSTLGLQLVITLVEQLSGQIELRNKNGATFEIKFPGAGYKTRV
jgi:PAS domain S-box-containing protein